MVDSNGGGVATALLSTFIITVLVVITSKIFSEYLVNRLKKDQEIFKTELQAKTSTDPLIRENHFLKKRVKNYRDILLFLIVALVNLKDDIDNLAFYISVALCAVLLFEPMLNKLFASKKVTI